ncbi:hypothetical protein COL922a_010571 [Colletotrichum nupharicola]|nr:hypothetical protein COL922a_010571 [Colletotrichum nupharicola]
MPSIKALAPEDVNYLRSKGAFTLPPARVREAMVRCYFHYVHPFAPILDANEFITEYEKGRKSLLLLWSMFIAAASFVDENLLTEDFYPSRRALKRGMYQRAKASQGTKPFWRRLWWSLYSREVWLSLGLGRPMRIAFDDFDTPMPAACDADVLSPEVAGNLGRKYLPGELGFLFDIWLEFVGLSATLGNILSTNYRAKGVKPSRADIERSEGQIRAFQTRVPEATNQSRVVASHIYQFKLYFE